MSTLGRDRGTVLVLRPGAIGDTVVALPAIEALRRRFRGASLHLFGNASCATLLLRLGLVERFTDFDAPEVASLLVSSRLKEAEVPVLGPVVAAVAWCSDPHGDLKRNLASLGAERVVVAPSRPPEGSREHVAAYLLRTLEPFGVTLPRDLRRWSLAVSELSGGEPPLIPRVAVHPGSGSPRKNWPPDYFARLIAMLAATAEGRLEILLVEGPADREACKVVREEAGVPLRELRCRPLLETARELGRCVAYVGNDSGITHLAGVLGIPTVAIFGPTDPQVWAPLGPRVQVLQALPLSLLAPEVVARCLLSTTRIDPLAIP